MTISCIVPNYNHESFLRERLDSILAQTRLPDEVILLDDCSTDGSRDILREYAALHPRLMRFSRRLRLGVVSEVGGDL